MGRLPWGREMQPFRHRESGGMEELQTDVMRFMAILAFCLVAIFALVQSLPLIPPASPRGTQDTRARPQGPAQALPVEQPPQTPPVEPPPQTSPVEQPPQAPEPAASPVPKPTPVRRPAPPVRKPDAPAQDQDPGFSLRFDSDAVLIRLVAGGRVGLYAFSDDHTWRMSTEGSGLHFAAAQRPARLNMTRAETVPGTMMEALRHAAPPDVLRRVSWGVTLPAATNEAIARLVRAFRNGTLVIHANGSVHREAPDTPAEAGGER